MRTSIQMEYLHQTLANTKSILKFYLMASTIINACLILALFCWAACADDTIAIQTIAYEASNQPIAGQIAVAGVIKRRIIERHQTSTEVCTAPYQFSCWHPKTGAATQARKITNKEMEVARQAWEQAQPDIYNHYCHYKVKPYWIKNAKASARIGCHVFYQL